MEDRVEALKQLKQPAQRSPEWYEARWKRLTASDVATALEITANDLKRAENGVFAFTKTPKVGKCCNPYQNCLSLIRKKCVPIEQNTFQGNVYTRWGQKYEPVATMIYEQRHGVKVNEFGLLLHPTIDILGASPDGICDTGTMLEIKCPFTREITGKIPHYYWIQVQIQLEVCDLEQCHFLECKLSEYRDREHFEQDCHETDPLLSSIGLEKGAIIEIKTSEDDLEPTYEYVPLGTSEEIDKWIDNWTRTQDLRPWIFSSKQARVIYWRLEKLSCVVVQRDREWFQESLPRLHEVWKHIETYREVGADKIPDKTCDLGKTSITVNIQSTLACKPESDTRKRTPLRNKFKFTMFRSDSESDNDDPYII